VADWQKVYGSSLITDIKYHEGSRECFVKFKSGAVYVYKDVPPEVWDELQHSHSKGRFVNVTLRRGYQYEAVSAAPVTEEKE
jgi:hypothetical protein